MIQATAAISSPRFSPAALGDPIADADAGALEGIAITGLNSSNGAWEYNVGFGWTAVGQCFGYRISLLLRSTDSLRFVPDGLNADMASITFAAWDQTSALRGPKPIPLSSVAPPLLVKFLKQPSSPSLPLTMRQPQPTARLSPTKTSPTLSPLADFNFGDVDGDSLTQIRYHQSGIGGFTGIVQWSGCPESGDHQPPTSRPEI